MKTEEQLLKYAKSYEEIIDGEIINKHIYLPVYVNDKILYEGLRRFHKNQHIRVDMLDVKDKTVVDIGCNTGYLSIQALKKGASYVLGLDYEYGVRIGESIKEIENLKNIDFRVFLMNASDLVREFPDLFDSRGLDAINYVKEYRGIKTPFDVGLFLSIYPIDSIIKYLKLSVDLAKTWYIEPTDHNSQTKEEIYDEGMSKLSLLGEVEFVGYTDYQNRGMFKVETGSTEWIPKG
jgi:SAM-dependent methyltransferase